MPVQWIRVRDTRTNDILPNSVPHTFLAKFEYLKEVPSSRLIRDRVRLEEPVQPQDVAPVTEPARDKAKPGQKPINEPAEVSDKKVGGHHA